MVVIDSATCISSMAQASPILANITSSLIPPQGHHNHQKNPRTPWPRELWLNSCYQQPGKLKRGLWKASATTSEPLSRLSCWNSLGSTGGEQPTVVSCGRGIRACQVHLCTICCKACLHALYCNRKRRGHPVTWLKFWTLSRRHKGLMNCALYA